MSQKRSEAIRQYKFKPSAWNGETRTLRVRASILNQVRAIAQWADKQEDPEAAIQRLLNCIDKPTASE